jgi:hypothetical protein
VTYEVISNVDVLRTWVIFVIFGDGDGGDIVEVYGSGLLEGMWNIS